MRLNNFKLQLVFSIIMVILINILLAVFWLLNGIDSTVYLLVIVVTFLWPIAIFISSKLPVKNVNRAPVELSIVGWLSLSGVLVAYNYFSEGNLTWAIYPVSGIALWPVGMLLYNYLYKKIGSK